MEDYDTQHMWCGKLGRYPNGITEQLLYDLWNIEQLTRFMKELFAVYNFVLIKNIIWSYLPVESRQFRDNEEFRETGEKLVAKVAKFKVTVVTSYVFILSCVWIRNNFK